MNYLIGFVIVVIVINIVWNVMLIEKRRKLIESVGRLLYERDGSFVFPENIYYYIQNEMSDKEFEKIINENR